MIVTPAVVCRPGGMLATVMRGWRRKVVVAVAAVVGLLLIAAWINSYRRHVVVGWADTGRAFNLSATRGRIAVRNARIDSQGNAVRFGQGGWYHSSSAATPMARAFPPRDCDIYWSLGPFNFLRGGTGGANLGAATWRISGHELIVPFWFVALVLIGVFALLIRLTRPRPTPGLCATCGYDLRASPDRCPECGAVA